MKTRVHPTQVNSADDGNDDLYRRHLAGDLNLQVFEVDSSDYNEIRDLEDKQDTTGISPVSNGERNQNMDDVSNICYKSFNM